MGHAKKKDLKKYTHISKIKNKNGACDCVCLCVGVWFRVSAWRVGAWVCVCVFSF